MPVRGDVRVPVCNNVRKVLRNDRNSGRTLQGKLPTLTVIVCPLTEGTSPHGGCNTKKSLIGQSHPLLTSRMKGDEVPSHLRQDKRTICGRVETNAQEMSEPLALGRKWASDEERVFQ